MNNYSVLLVDSPLLIPMLLFEAFGFVALCGLCVLNGMIFWNGIRNPKLKKLFWLRILLCKRISILMSLIVLVQTANVAISLLLRLTSGEGAVSMPVQFGWSLYPITCGIWIMVFGVVQFVLFDTMMRYRVRQDGIGTG